MTARDPWSRRNGRLQVQVLQRPLGPHASRILVRYRAPSRQHPPPPPWWHTVLGPSLVVLFLLLVSLIVRGGLRWPGGF